MVSYILMFLTSDQPPFWVYDSVYERMVHWSAEIHRSFSLQCGNPIAAKRFRRRHLRSVRSDAPQL